MRIGIDTGGTFTDLVSIRDGKIEIFKEPSTPQAPEQAILAGLGTDSLRGRIGISSGVRHLLRRWQCRRIRAMSTRRAAAGRRAEGLSC